MLDTGRELRSQDSQLPTIFLIGQVPYHHTQEIPKAPLTSSRFIICNNSNPRTSTITWPGLHALLYSCRYVRPATFTTITNMINF